MPKVVIVGLGYVGLPIAISFAKKYETYGFDINKEKVDKYIAGIDITGEIGTNALKETKLIFTTNPEIIKKADYIIVTVPTPIDNKKNPDLSFVENATELIGRNLTKGSIIIYESTVYPGTTEEICIPILEKVSKMKCNEDFFVGYSPERINPGDKQHTFVNITKIVSGSRNDITKKIANLYQQCLQRKVIEVSSIKVAEAAKIIENAQRDINIAFINEISKIFHIMNIDTKEVLQAASTKWNFMNFKPGLVGGHCIGVDPYYLSYKAEQLGFIPQVILAGRKVNDSMGEYIAENLEKTLIDNNIELKNAKVLIKGLTFKENIRDIRNSKVIDIVRKLKSDEINVFLDDYYVDDEEFYKAYQLSISKNIPKVDAIIIATKHNEYCKMNIKELEILYNEKNEKKILFDLHSIFNKQELEKKEFKVWNL